MIAGVPIAGLTAPALVGIGVLLVMTGLLVPRRTYTDVREDRDEWHKAHTESEAARNQQAKQIDALLEVGKTVEAIMRSIPHPLDREVRDDDAPDA